MVDHKAMKLRVQTDIGPGNNSCSGAAGFDNRGVALLMVLWVLVLLSVVVGEFCYSMRAEINITRNLKEKATVYYIALAGVHTALGEIAAKGGLPLQTKEIESMGGEEEEVHWRTNADIAAMPYKDGYFKVWIDDESGRFDLNVVDKQTIVKLLSGFELDDLQRQIIADSILDWRDTNNLHRVNGAEDDYYQSLPAPYFCKDGAFESVAELRLVRGVTEDLFVNGFRDIFTVLEPDQKTQGVEVKVAGKVKGKIDLNAAPRIVLLSLPGMSEETVDEILEFRSGKDFLSLSDVVALLGADTYQKIAPYVKLGTSGYYTIHSVGRLNDSRVEHYMRVLIAVDPKAEKKYRVIKWWDQAAS
jgi:general secretion pathway protein K